jgi:hypothetical protein
VIPLTSEVAERVVDAVRTTLAVLRDLAALSRERRQLASALGLLEPALLEDARLRRTVWGISEVAAAVGAAIGRAQRTSTSPTPRER